MAHSSRCMRPALTNRAGRARSQGLTGISGMSSTVAIINHNSAMQRESDGGQVNGYNTIHYSIDTARFSATERQMLLSRRRIRKR